MPSKIEWTDETWNPLRGCTRVSAGCEGCYAEGISARFSGPGMAFEGVAKMVHGKPHWTGQIKLVPEKLAEPLRWRKPRMVFVNSMSDLFHEGVPDEFIDQVFAVMALTPQHTYQVLTKRPERMAEYMKALYAMERRVGDAAYELLNAGVEQADRSTLRPMALFQHAFKSSFPNVWLGVSVEDQATADERIPHLLNTPAAVRFVSYEPALGTVDFTTICTGWYFIDALRGYRYYDEGPARADCPSLDWIICGGESGPNARPMHPDWARSVRDQCAEAGVPFFFKQWGEFLPIGQSSPGFPCAEADPEMAVTIEELNDHRSRVGKKAAGHLLDGVAHRGFPGRSE